VIVIDASVLAVALGDDEVSGIEFRTRLRGEVLVAPALIDVEVTSAWRSQMASGQLTEQRAERAISDLISMPLRRIDHRHLLPRCWELRSNLTVYDACYVALAELLGAVLLTADAKLAKLPGLKCKIELMA
jgi:predicted nucleic acid-binding protein